MGGRTSRFWAENAQPDCPACLRSGRISRAAVQYNLRVGQSGPCQPGQFGMGTTPRPSAAGHGQDSPTCVRAKPTARGQVAGHSSTCLARTESHWTVQLVSGLGITLELGAQAQTRTLRPDLPRTVRSADKCPFDFL